eukprot:PhM_4_TR3146/c0_g1_i1/m.86811
MTIDYSAVVKRLEQHAHTLQRRHRLLRDEYENTLSAVAALRSHEARCLDDYHELVELASGGHMPGAPTSQQQLQLIPLTSENRRFIFDALTNEFSRLATQFEETVGERVRNLEGRVITLIARTRCVVGTHCLRQYKVVSELRSASPTVSLLSLLSPLPPPNYNNNALIRRLHDVRAQVEVDIAEYQAQTRRMKADLEAEIAAVAEQLYAMRSGTAPKK